MAACLSCAFFKSHDGRCFILLFAAAAPSSFSFIEQRGSGERRERERTNGWGGRGGLFESRERVFPPDRRSDLEVD